MSETKMQFITRLMNDPNIRQRLKASEDRRAYCEECWEAQQDGEAAAAMLIEPKTAEGGLTDEDDGAALAEAMPEALEGEPEPEPDDDQAEADEPDQARPGEVQVDAEPDDQAGQ